MIMLIDPTTHVVNKDYWVEEIENDPRLLFVQTVNLWPEGVTYRGPEYPWWTFKAACDDLKGSGGWTKDELAMIASALKQRKLGHNWVVYKELTPFALVNAPYKPYTALYQGYDIAVRFAGSSAYTSTRTFFYQGESAVELATNING